MNCEHITHDIHGLSIAKGCRVRIFRLLPETISVIPSDELDEVLTMVGEIFEVDDVDEYGQAWVYKNFRTDEDDDSVGYYSHSLGLAPGEMERIG